MKRIIYLGIVLITSLFSNLAHAVLEGPYAGLALGNSKITAKSATIGPEASSGTTTVASGLSGGLIAGYKINKYGALEAGFMHFANGRSNTSCGSALVKTNGFDIVGKGMYPFGSTGLEVFAKAGLEALQAKGNTCIPGGTQKTSSTEVRATAMFGGSYDISQTMVAEFFYQRIFVNSSLIKDINFIGLGITYHFVDVYCGQFLC